MLPAHRLADAHPHPVAGPLMLSGGRDHTRASEPVDRALLACLDTATPRVVVIPAAVFVRTRSAAEIRALRHWSRLGATVDLVTVDRGTAHLDPPAALHEADLIVLTGGRPGRSVTTTATALWPHIVRRWRQGAALSGSSVGATVLSEWRQHVGAGRPLRFVRGHGVVPDAVAPHFDRPVVRRWTMAASRAQPYLTIVGLDERTAIVGRDGRYTVHGSGAVTIVRAGAGRRYGTGSNLNLSVGAATATPQFPHPWAPVGTTRPGRVAAAPEPLSG